MCGANHDHTTRQCKDITVPVPYFRYQPALSPMTTKPDKPTECNSCSHDEFETEWMPTDPSEPGGQTTETFSHYVCERCNEIHHDQRSSQPDPETSDGYYIEDWEDIFGHPAPYDHQADGIDAAIDTGNRDGFTLIEGGCGTGKTMIALTTGIQLVRDPESKYERVFVLTSVKQQLRQFESDLSIINSNLPDGIEKVKGLTLQGKADLCPYRREGSAGFTMGNCHRRCKRLRANTVSKAQGDAENLTQMFQDAEKQARLRSGNGKKLSTAGAESPYLDELPEETDTQYCPFYAKYKAQDNDVTFDVSDAENSVMDSEELTRVAVERGSCPHSAMSALMTDAEVIVGNYYHAFDADTLNLTGGLIDDKTFLVCDEAHMLVPRVRSILSDSVDLYEIKLARQELARVLRQADSKTQGGRDGFKYTASELQEEYQNVGKSGAYIDPAMAKEEFEKQDISVDHARYTFEFLTQLEENVRSYITDWLDTEHDNWENELFDLPKFIEMALRDPEQPRNDVITRWAEGADYGGEVWEDMPAVATAIENIINNADNDAQDAALKPVGKLMKEWHARDETQYFREIVLKEDPMKNMSDWRRRYNASIELHNCIPSGMLYTRLNQFGGGILMSATLDPIDVFQELTGLTFLQEMEGRPVTEKRYPINFPKENRESLMVDAPKFTYSNRQAPGSKNETRRQYGDVIKATARSPGNVLVCMPSYSEAEWAAGLIENSNIGKPVLVDESSSEGETQQLKEEFFKGQGKVMVTSLRGTLIEGVDYAGDKLQGVVICGVPIENVGSPRTLAVQTAYKAKFGDFLGFQYSMLVPAVRKTRQAIGRVIRGADDVGVRVLIDERYTNEDEYSSVGEYLGDEGDDFDTVAADDVAGRIESFWTGKGQAYQR